MSFISFSGETKKENPTGVFADGVHGRPNNWRSLDSRTIVPANIMPKLTTFFANYSSQPHLALQDSYDIYLYIVIYKKGAPSMPQG